MNFCSIEYTIQLKNGMSCRYKEGGFVIIFNDYEFSFNRVSDKLRVIYNLNEDIKTIKDITIHKD